MVFYTFLTTLLALFHRFQLNPYFKSRRRGNFLEKRKKSRKNSKSQKCAHVSNNFIYESIYAQKGSENKDNCSGGKKTLQIIHYLYFDKPLNNFVAAISEYASWGYFDPGENNYRDGYQSVPVQWGINTPRKQAFFEKVREMVGNSA